MNKFSILTVTLISAAAILSGCSGKDELSEPPVNNSSSSVADETPVENNDESSDIAEHNAQEETEAETSAVENHEIVRDIKLADGTYVYDYAGVLSSEAFTECNNYAEWLYETFLINAAVVTTDDVEGLTAEQYAQNAYVDLYGGRGSGLLLLINNDTNEDYLYKTGSCLVSISEDTQANEFYWATQEIINGDYKSAVLRLMKLGEACPQHVFDNGGLFTAEDITTLESSCSSGSTDISVLATSNTTGSTNEEICRSYYERHYQESKGIMVMLDEASNTFTVVSDNALPDGLDSAIEQANAICAARNYASAANSLVLQIQTLLR